VFIAAGIIALGNTVATTLVSTMVLGICAIVGGGFEIAHACWTKGWGGFIWQVLLGVLLLAAGVVLVAHPMAGSLVLTYVFGLVLLVSGVLRVVLGMRLWARLGGVLVLSGIFGIGAGLVVLAGWPATGLWVIGFVLGVDMVMQGAGWLFVAMRLRRAG
jgi:uncharacterized membrane protein HdeD (DUF308 family)